MDRRHSEIVEGAGLEESRINADFADWLKRWGSPILLIVLVLALGYRGWMWYQQKQVQALDSAFIDLDAAAQAGQPMALLQVANDWDGRATVSSQARLEAADRLLMAYSVGIVPGGSPGVVEDIATTAARDGYLEQARNLYTEVQAATEGKPTQVILQMHALSGLAAVESSLAKFDVASSYIERLIEIANQNRFEGLATAMQERLAILASNPIPAPLPSQELIVVGRPTTPPPTPEEGDFLTPEELMKELGPTPAPTESGVETEEPPAEGEGGDSGGTESPASGG